MVIEDPRVDKVPDCLVPKTDLTETVDSGMEDNSGSVMQGDSSDEDDGEIIGKKQVNKSKQRLILDEDSDASDSEARRPKPQTFSAEQVLEAVMADSSDDTQNTTDLTSSVKKRKIKRPVADDSSSDEEKEVVKKVEEKVDSGNVEDSVLNADAITSMEDEDKTSPNKANSRDENTAGSEDSSDSRSSSGSESDRSDNENDGENEDDEFNEGSIDPKLLAKLKKGAGKKPREKSARISKQEEKMSIHSESQRIVREGRVNLPYHQPAPRSLNDFLARATKKQQEYRSLRGAVRDTRKAKVIEGVLQNSRLQVKEKTQEDMDKYSDSDDDWDPEKEKVKSLLERVSDKLQNECDKSTDTTGNSQPKEATNCDSEKSVTNDCEMGVVLDEKKDELGNVNDDSDSLPDLEVEIEKAKDENKKVNSDTANTEDSVNGENSGNREDAVIKEVTISKEDLVNQEASVSNTAEIGVIETNENSKLESQSEDLMFDWEKPEINEKNMDTEKSDVLESDLNTVKDVAQPINTVDPFEDKENNLDNITESSNKDNENNSAQTKSSPSTKSDKKLKKEKLLALAGIDLNIVQPKLSGDTETFISLVEEEEAPKHPGVVKLMDRLSKHTAKKEKKHSKDLDISIVSKDKVGIDKEELKLNTFTYHIEEEDSNPLLKLEVPGAKLLALKEQLQGKIKEKRELARQKRQELYNLDNEEGDFGADEEEMSEHSDTDIDDDEFNEQFGGEEEEEDEEEAMLKEKGREKNLFADDQAEEEGDEEDEEEGEDLDEEYGDIDDKDKEIVDDDDDDNDADDEDDDEMNLKLDVSDEDEEESETTESKRQTDEVKRTESVTEDDTSDAPDFKEPSPKKLPEKPFSMFGQRSRDNSFTDTQIQSGQKPSNLRLQIEDSQDLYGTLPQLAPTPEASVTQSSPQSYNFLLEDSQSVMMDADGYLKTKSTGKKQSSKISALEDLAGTQGDMGDVLGFCSGKFVSQVDSKNKSSKKSLFDESSVSNTQNMDELMGLCSGVFVDSKESQSRKQGTKRKVSNDDDDDDDGSIEALSDNEARDSDKDNQSEDEQGDTDHLDEEGEEDQEEQPKEFTGFLQKKGKIRKEFVDEEAELSGSEYDSDENLDLPEEEDIMEIEEADREMANVDQEQLRDEVGRVHLKQLIDEDKRELLRFQEMYLADGDLHSEGGGRMRRFRWSNMDDDTQQDMFGDGSDGEAPEQEDAEETQWRKERHEREKFLKEQQEKEMNDSENSQFLKFGKVFLKKQASVDDSSIKKDKPVDAISTNQADTPGFPGSFYKLSKQKRGSFLARSKETLAKIAEMTKPVTNPSAGAKSSGKFTFQVISPDKERDQPVSPTKKKRKAHVPAQKSNSGFKKPPLKKQKLDTSENSQNSVFNHLY